ncbi:MAG TPA: helix-turn-helix domain-containing protein [Micromonosporaceae bacterium]
MDVTHKQSELEWLVPALEARLPDILTEVRALFSVDWPDYAEFLAHEQDDVAIAAKAFTRWLVEIAERPGVLPRENESEPQVALFEEIGRVQWREGRELTTLLSAYQVGARVAWRHVSSAALEFGVPPTGLAALAEAVFIFIDQLSSASARGFVLEQSRAAVERERLRDDLVEMLLSDRCDTELLRAAAARAGWPLPREAAVILVDPNNDAGQAIVSRLDSSWLLIRRRTLIGAIVPDPVGPGRRQRLVDALAGAGAVVGHPVPLQHLPASVHIAEVAAALQRAGVLEEDPVFADEHLDAIIVHRDPRLLDALRRTVLAPLDGHPVAVRERLTSTLACWLRHFGDRKAMAAELHVHPQTVRYRMAQLHDLFGAALDDPAERARLTLALVWNRPAPARASAGAGARRQAAAAISEPLR